MTKYSIIVLTSAIPILFCKQKTEVMPFGVRFSFPALCKARSGLAERDWPPDAHT